jgi:hypothetical protein
MGLPNHIIDLVAGLERQILGVFTIEKAMRKLPSPSLH